jgi:flap endonuclease-1
MKWYKDVNTHHIQSGMGIKKFHDVIKKHAPGAYIDLSFEDLANKRLGIDVSGFLHRYMVGFGKERWIDGFVHLFIALRSAGVKFVLLFDGVAPPEKDAERQKRKDAKDKLQQKAEDILWLIEHLEELEMDSLVCETDEELARAARVGKISPLGGKTVNRVELASELKKVENQCVLIRREDTNAVKELAECMGITSIQAPGEAEAFGAYMSVHNLLDGMITDDTDVLAYGCNYYRVSLRERTVQYVEHLELCGEIDFTPNQLTDLAILLGNDYNSNIPGVGPVGAVTLLREHGNIEAILEATGKDGTNLNYIKSRELFSVPDLDYVQQELDILGIKLPFVIGNIDRQKLPFFMEMKNIKVELDKVRRAWKAGRSINARCVEFVRR